MDRKYKTIVMEDLEGHRDWQMLAPVTSPAPSFRTEDFVRLTDGAVGSICRSFGDGPADYRKEMLFGQELNQNQMDMNCKKIRLLRLLFMEYKR